MVIDRRVRGVEVDSVLIDNVEAACKLLSTCLTMVIGALGPCSAWQHHRTRTARGLLQAFKARGLKPALELLSYIDVREEEGYKATQQLLGLPEPPEAILASNGLMAVGAFARFGRTSCPFPTRLPLPVLTGPPGVLWLNRPLP
ncbi:MAG: hypothetical protein HS126_38745 [Anaerolineales bacterium]|nr:hypothetical protein [Anaerolineales bacterium]